jgi:hypothetical protein
LQTFLDGSVVFESWIERRSPGHVAAMRQWMQQMRPQHAATKA